ncbi:hypothetical protein ACJX0J_023267, partial [Zea mays]
HLSYVSHRSLIREKTVGLMSQLFSWFLSSISTVTTLLLLVVCLVVDFLITQNTVAALMETFFCVAVVSLLIVMTHLYLIISVFSYGHSLGNTFIFGTVLDACQETLLTISSACLGRLGVGQENKLENHERDLFLLENRSNIL